MNLVQIQERLKELPTPALMQIANGGSPIAPPYLALGELKRRESMMKAAQPQQGPMPSVKEQVEQAAGLAGLQKQMQAQGMQSLMAQARPQGIPQNIPQPESQPESEGVAGLPAGDFKFANGGIVAFAGDTDGSYVRGGDSSFYQSQIEKLRQFNQDPEVLALQRQRDEFLRSGKPVQANAAIARINDIRQRYMQPSDVQKMEQSMLEEQRSAVRTPRTIAPQVPSSQPAVIPQETTQRSTPEQYATARSKMVGDPQEVLRDVMAISDPVERAAALDSLKRPKPDESPQDVAPMAPSAPAMPPQGIAAIPGADEGMKMMLETMRAKPTLEAEATEAEKAKGLFGLTQPYGEERMKRLQAMEAARQQDLGDRGLERLMRVMGGIAGRGLPGAGAAYLQSVGEERAADAAFRKQMDELLGGVEEARRREATTGMTEAQKRKAKKEEMAIGAAEKIMDADTKFKVQELQTKAVMGRLSPEDEYVRREIAKGRPYPEIKQELAHAGSLKEELKDTDLQKWAVQEAIKAWGDLGSRENPNKLSQAEWVRQKAEEIYRLQKGISGMASANAAVPADIAPLLKKYGAK